MAEDAEEGQEEWEAIDEEEQEMDGDDGVDELGEKPFGEDGMLFDQLGEVVESRCCSRAEGLVPRKEGGGGRCWKDAPMDRARKEKPRTVPM